MPIISKQSHSSAQELSNVHKEMIAKIQLKKEVDEAKEMQQYLQYFKKIFYHPEDYTSNEPILQGLGLEEEIIKQMRTRFQQILGVTSQYQQIFRSEHKHYQARKDFDDIVEGELNALLQVIAEKATGINNVTLGQKITGSQSVNIIGDFSKITIDELIKSFEGKITKKTASKIIEDMKVSARSGKIDNTGYSRELVLNATILPQFGHFINLFTGKNFSVKNYKSNNQYDIHLGSTAVFKAMFGTLTYLGYNQEDSTHIYSHAFASWKKRPNVISRNNDIFHLRFMYELMGGGLIDIETGKPLDAVDFLIYNAPDTEQIYVKSTKQLVQEIINNKTIKIQNPWKGIYISKLNFN